MYTISIFSQTAQSWRTLSVKTLSECVQLTLGLSTNWVVESVETIPCTGTWGGSINQSTVLACDSFQPLMVADNGKRYAHSLRALVQRWKCSDYSPIVCFRMSDSALLAYHSSINPLNVW